MTNKLYADTNGVSYTYTPDGKLATRAWARGITTTYSYTNTEEMVGIDYSDTTPDIVFTHDRIGRQMTVADAQGTHIFGYDPLTLALTNEVVVADGLTNVIARNQDSLGRSSGFSLATGTQPVDYTVAYTYDEATGRFSGLQSSVSGLPSNHWQYSYLPDTDMISHIAESNAGMTNIRSYEPNRNLLTGIHNQSQGATISMYQYQNDAIGRRTQRIDTTANVVTNDFAYNTRSELIAAAMGGAGFAWSLDPVGNRTSATKNETTRFFDANELNQYTSISNGGLRLLSYDLDGHLTNDAVFVHVYNGENRLVSSEPIIVTNGSQRVMNAYDYQGRRFRKVVETWDGAMWGSAATNIFVYDGYGLIQEQDATGGVIRAYIRGLDMSGTLQGAGGTGGLLAMLSGSNTYYYFGDANGNITELVDTNGQAIAHYQWDAYGNRLNAPGGSEPENPLGFSSQYRDNETNLDMYIFRPYSPELERWVHRDPIGERGAQTIYHSPLSGRIYSSFFARIETDLMQRGSILAAQRLRRFEQKRRSPIFEVGSYVFSGNCPSSRYDILGLFADGPDQPLPPLPPPPPEGPPSPCSLVDRRRNEAGGIVCNGGAQVICIWPDAFHGPVSDAVLACVRAHEEKHAEKNTCDPNRCGYYRAPTDPDDPIGDECSAWLVTYGCLDRINADPKPDGWDELFSWLAPWIETCTAGGYWDVD